MCGSGGGCPPEQSGLYYKGPGDAPEVKRHRYSLHSQASPSQKRPRNSKTAGLESNFFNNEWSCIPKGPQNDLGVVIRQKWRFVRAPVVEIGVGGVHQNNDRSLSEKRYRKPISKMNANQKAC